MFKLGKGKCERCGMMVILSGLVKITPTKFLFECMRKHALAKRFR